MKRWQIQKDVRSTGSTTLPQIWHIFLEIPNNVEPCVQGYQFNYIPLGKNFGFTPRIPINFYEKWQFLICSLEFRWSEVWELNHLALVLSPMIPKNCKIYLLNCFVTFPGQPHLQFEMRHLHRQGVPDRRCFYPGRMCVYLSRWTLEGLPRGTKTKTGHHKRYLVRQSNHRLGSLAQVVIWGFREDKPFSSCFVCCCVQH